MTVLRRHLFAILAACVALAVGIALGAGPLQGSADERQQGGRTDEGSVLADRLSALEQRRVFDDAMTQVATGGLLADRLTRRPVTLVVLPGVPAETVDGVRTAVQRAGGWTAVTAHVQPDLIDPGKKTYVASVAANSLRGVEDLGQAATGETYDQLGALLARAYVGRANDDAFDDEAVKIDSELRGAKLVELDADPGRRGSLVVILAPGDHGAGAMVSASNVIRTALVHALAAAGDGSLVAAPPTASQPGGLIAALGAGELSRDSRVSTLNTVDGVGGLVAAVFALAATVDGKPGDYGVIDGQAALPPGLVLPGE